MDSMDAYEITVQELNQRNRGSYRLIDIRDPLAFSYGHLPGAENIPAEILKGRCGTEKGHYEAAREQGRYAAVQGQEELRTEALGGGELVIYCKKGETGRELAQWLREQGLEAYNLQGGYLAWLVDAMGQEPEGEDRFYLDVEQSLRKKFHKRI